MSPCICVQGAAKITWGDFILRLLKHRQVWKLLRQGPRSLFKTNEVNLYRLFNWRVTFTPSCIYICYKHRAFLVVSTVVKKWFPWRSRSSFGRIVILRAVTELLQVWSHRFKHVLNCLLEHKAVRCCVEFITSFVVRTTTDFGTLTLA